MSRRRHAWIAAAAALAAGCAVNPPPADWRVDAHEAMQGAVEAALRGQAGLEATQAGAARRATARAGRTDLLARLELLRCAAHVAGLDFEPCQGFEPHRADASAPDRAYADHLAGRPLGERAALLPAAQRGAAAWQPGTPATPVLAAIDDPLGRLVAAAVMLQRALAATATTAPAGLDAAALALAVETASERGWSRPLLAWLLLQVRDAEARGDAGAAAAAKRRISVVEAAGAGR